MNLFFIGDKMSLINAQCHEASLMQGWVRASRILALVEHENEWALFLFISSRMPPEVFTDLAIERIIPVDNDFKCEIGM